MTVEDFHKYLEEHVIKEEDKENIFPPPLNAQVAVNILCKHFLGDDWYVVDPIHNAQVNTIIVEEILSKYPRSRDMMKKMKEFFMGVHEKSNSLV